MSGLIKEPQFSTIAVRELHPTFGAEIKGVDFDNLSDEQFNEVKTALAKVNQRLSLSSSTGDGNLLLPKSPETFVAIANIEQCKSNAK